MQVYRYLSTWHGQYSVEEQKYKVKTLAIYNRINEELIFEQTYDTFKEKVLDCKQDFYNKANNCFTTSRSSTRDKPQNPEEANYVFSKDDQLFVILSNEVYNKVYSVRGDELLERLKEAFPFTDEHYEIDPIFDKTYQTMHLFMTSKPIEALFALQYCLTLVDQNQMAESSQTEQVPVENKAVDDGLTVIYWDSVNKNTKSIATFALCEDTHDEIVPESEPLVMATYLMLNKLHINRINSLLKQWRGKVPNREDIQFGKCIKGIDFTIYQENTIHGGNKPIARFIIDSPRGTTIHVLVGEYFRPEHYKILLDQHNCAVVLITNRRQLDTFWSMYQSYLI